MKIDLVNATTRQDILVVLTTLLLPIILALSTPSAAQGTAQTNRMPWLEREPPRVLSDGQFVQGPNVRGFVLAEYLADQPGILKLEEYRSVIQDQADYFGINPKVLLTFVEMHSGLVTAASPSPQLLDQPAAYPARAGFVPQMQWLGETLANSFYAHSYTSRTAQSGIEVSVPITLTDGVVVLLPGQTNAGTYAVLATLATLHDSTTWADAASAVSPIGFYKTYVRLFPEDNPLDDSNVVGIESPPADLLKLPYSCNDTWRFLQGPHDWNGVCTPPFSSIDFGPGSSCSENPPGDQWITAAAAGTVIDVTCGGCMIKIDHGDGWESRYYHVVNAQVSGGQYVSRDTRLGNPSCRPSYGGTCGSCGGSASGQHHVHFGLYRNGLYEPIDGTSLEGWIVHETGCYAGYLQLGTTIVNEGGSVNSQCGQGCCGCASAPSANTQLFSALVNAPQRAPRIDATTDQTAEAEPLAQPEALLFHVTGTTVDNHRAYAKRSGYDRPVASYPGQIPSTTPDSIPSEGQPLSSHEPFGESFRSLSESTLRLTPQIDRIKVGIPLLLETTQDTRSRSDVSPAVDDSQRDETQPKLAVRINAGDSTSSALPVTIRVVAQDEGSGVESVHFSSDQLGWTDWLPYEPSWTWVLEHRPEYQVVFAQVRDRAGNLSEIVGTGVTPTVRSGNPVSNDYVLSKSVVGMGGGQKVSASYRLQNTTGQTTGVQRLQGAGYQVFSGFWPSSPNHPLAATLAYFSAHARNDHVMVTWETVSETQNQGFNLYRSTMPEATGDLLAFVPSQAPGSASGASYHWQDTDVAAGQTYWYWLEDVDVHGTITMHGSVSVTLNEPTAVALGKLSASTRSAGPWSRWIETLRKSLR